MQSMQVNTVRVYVPLDEETAVSTHVLDECYRRGIMVILTVAPSRKEIDDGSYLAVVDHDKNHPAILMWALGNEWNLNQSYGDTALDARQRTNDVAMQITLHDNHHPVSSVLGDRLTEPPTTCDPAADSCGNSQALQASQGSSIPAIVSAAPAVDVWGINVYRGTSFGDLFTQWKAATSKPMYLSEFSADSFITTGYERLTTSSALVRHVTGSVGAPRQAQFVTGLWQELRSHLSALTFSESALGGLVHEFNDELWKVGCFHVGLGGIQVGSTSVTVLNYKMLMPLAHPLWYPESTGGAPRTRLWTC